MNPHRVLLLGCTLAFTTAAVTAQAETKPVPYHYGMPMDIQKVISMTEPQTRDCKVIEAQIKFVDKAGEVQQVSYKKLSEACLFQN
ncbi:DUF2790 domain-containing protein [Pseudomonas sp. SWRI18]|uniref:DUF2790 domain-containing protein n=1 Tax=Pseudomonas sp. SWRI18 TaxID=2753888 RepID=UPI00164456EA|nr:DUF2790 domain-containing protein [Pseudomonas sp. SWRI18]MBC3302590.1 DUF2790 domain-containing protein [Pseudomonas sp. SWRI18]